MALDAGLRPVKDGSHFKGRLHDAEGFLYLPQLVVGVYDLHGRHVQGAGLDGVVPVEQGVPFNGVFVQDPLRLFSHVPEVLLAAALVVGFDLRRVSQQPFRLLEQTSPVRSVLSRPFPGKARILWACPSCPSLGNLE